MWSCGTRPASRPGRQRDIPLKPAFTADIVSVSYPPAFLTERWAAHFKPQFSTLPLPRSLRVPLAPFTGEERTKEALLRFAHGGCTTRRRLLLLLRQLCGGRRVRDKRVVIVIVIEEGGTSTRGGRLRRPLDGGGRCGGGGQEREGIVVEGRRSWGGGGKGRRRLERAQRCLGDRGPRATRSPFVDAPHPASPRTTATRLPVLNPAMARFQKRIVEVGRKRNGVPDAHDLTRRKQNARRLDEPQRKTIAIVPHGRYSARPRNMIRHQ